MVQSLKFKNFLVVGQQKERQINIAVPCLFHDKERASILQIILLKRDAIEDVRVDLDEDLVTIKFDSGAIEKSDLFNLLEDVLANFSEKPPENIKKSRKKCTQCGGLEREVVFSVEGMSCASCALYLEMILSRNKKVSNACIDFDSKKGLVVGCLTQNDVLEIVENHGYKAHSMVCAQDC